jgi:hypothetical protein
VSAAAKLHALAIERRTPTLAPPGRSCPVTQLSVIERVSMNDRSVPCRRLAQLGIIAEADCCGPCHSQRRLQTVVVQAFGHHLLARVCCSQAKVLKARALAKEVSA